MTGERMDENETRRKLSLFDIPLLLLKLCNETMVRSTQPEVMIPQ